MLIGNSSTLMEEEVLFLLVFIRTDTRYAHSKPIFFFFPPEWDKNHLWVLPNSSWIMKVSSLAVGQFQTLYECQPLFPLILSGDYFSALCDVLIWKGWSVSAEHSSGTLQSSRYLALVNFVWYGWMCIYQLSKAIFSQWWMGFLCSDFLGS